MRKALNIVLTAFFMLLITASIQAETPKTSEPADRWAFIAADVADVNGIKVSKDDLLLYMKTAGDPKEFYSLSGKALDSYTHEMLGKLINQIILAKFAEDAGFKPGFELIKSETEKIIKKMPPEEKKQFMGYLSSQKMDVDAFCKKRAADKFAARQFAIDTWFDSDIKKNITVTDKEIEKFYAEAEDILSVSQILIKYDGNSPEAKAEAKKHAEELLIKIRAGEDFNKIAATESGCSSSNGGVPGALPPFGRGQMVQEFEDAAFALPVGSISDVVETDFGFHIIKVNKKSKRPLPPLSQIKEKIKEEIITIKGQDIVIKKLKDAKKEWKVTVTGFKK